MMSRMDREQRIKLHLLTSLARSQRSLSRMLESVAACYEGSPEMSRHLARHIGAISKYQRMLTRKMLGISIRYPKRGIPGKPWISSKVTACSKEGQGPDESRPGS